MIDSFPKRRLFAPQVFQDSPADCGAAVLKSALQGFDIPVSHERLRQACQTQVDGTSVDGVEKLALQLGLEAQQVMLPPDHLLLPQVHALPSIVLTRQPDGLIHFVLAWRAWGPFIQVMDPSAGRRWPSKQSFLNEVYVHTFPVQATDWREWAGSEEFCAPLRQRLASLKVDGAVMEHLLNTARQDPAWRSLAALDAVTRMLERIARVGGLKRGREAQQGLERFFEQARKDASDGVWGRDAHVPPSHWSVSPAKDKEQLFLRGAVLVQILGRQQLPTPADQPLHAAKSLEPQEPEPVARRQEPRYQPEREIWQLLRADGRLLPVLFVSALILAAVGVIIQALLFQGIMALAQQLDLIGHRIQIMQGVFALACALLFLQLFIPTATSYFGSQIEVRLRIAFLKKIPQLSVHYFDKLRTANMVGQSYELRRLYELPEIVGQLLQAAFQMLLTALGVIWLNPTSTPIVIAITVFSIGAQLVIAPMLIKRYTRVITYLSALSRFYLDALLGLVPVQAHGAEQAIRREHENSLVKWTRASKEYHRFSTLTQAVVKLVNTALAVLILFNYVARGGEARNALLLLYWTLNLPILGTQLTVPLQRYPRHRHALARLLELGRAPDEALELPGKAAQETHASERVAGQQLADTPKSELPRSQASALAIVMQNVTVQLDGQTILADIDFSLKAGEHIAIVGSSGAGKSSLVGILLGWYQPTIGRVLVDGEPLTGSLVQALRREIAWVDPAVQLWNHSLLYNLLYGSYEPQPQITQAIEKADLLDVLTRLPQGLQTVLGEGGGLISGGEGQRVRLARAMLRSGARLVILDEPFRGLDRKGRHKLLSNARQYWQDATLICVTHDVGETIDFGRVLVVEQGRIVEDDVPSRLIALPNSRYRTLLEAEKEVRKGLWTGVDWQRLWLQDKQLRKRKDA